jgi:outer membrane protein assembly factor BamE (lipoprotein component of BamABCDE complex)
MNLKKRLSFIGISCALAFLFISGCGTTGQEFNSNQVKKIIKNETTKEDVLKLFGTPNRKGVENGRDMWIYEYNKYSFGKSYSKDLNIIFDATGKVLGFNATSNFPKNE